MPLPGPPPGRRLGRRRATALPTISPRTTIRRAPKPKPKPRPKPAAAPAAPAPGNFDWGDGLGARHTISLGTHRRHVADQAANANPLYNPTQQLSGADLKNAASDLVNTEYGPQRAALQRELENVTTQGTALADRSAGYSSQLAASDATLVPKVGDIGNDLLKQLASNAGEAKTAVNATLTDANSASQADATLRGISSGQPSSSATETQQQLERLAANTQTDKDAAAAQTANYQGLASIAAASRAQMGQEIHGQLLNRLANNQGDVRARQGDEAKQEGAARSKAVTDLRQQAFENLITQQGLNIKSKDIEAQTSLGQARINEQAKARRQRARDAKAGRTLRKTLDKSARDAAATKDANAVNEIGISNADWLKMTPQQRQDAIINFQRRKTIATTRPAKPAAPKPEAQGSLTKKSRIDSMITDIGTDPKLSHHQYETGPRLVQILVHRGADPLEAQAAAEIARHGAITPETEAKLRDAGVRIPRRWRGTKATGRDRQPG